MTVPALPLVAALLLAAAPRSGAPPVPVPDPAGPVVGVVVDSTGAPLATVVVGVARAWRSAPTEADGSFSLGTLPPGRYHLEATRVGYAPAHADVTVSADAAAAPVRIVMTATPLELEGLVVTGVPAGASTASSRSVVQLSGRELDRSLGSTVAATLAEQPGVRTRYNGPAAATPVIRGLTGDRVLVLRNGERTGDLSGASADHALSVDPLQASRIEVVRGPASLMYGSSALGGVVNVIGEEIPTEVPGRPSGSLTTQAESATPGGAVSASATIPVGGRMAATLLAGMRRVDDVRTGGGGVLDNTDFRNHHGDVGIGYVGESLTAGLAGSAYRFEYGLPYAPGAAEAGVHIRGDREQLTGRGEWSRAEGTQRQLRASATAQRYSHDEVEPSGEVATNFRLNTQTLDVRGSLALGALRASLGASALAKQYSPTGEEALTPPADSRSAGAFAYAELPLGPGDEHDEVARLQAGLRYDLYRIESRAGDPERFGPGRTLDFGALSGSAGLTVPLARGVTLGGSVARAFRAPTVEELLSNGYHAAAGSYDVGDASLEAETNTGGELVLHAATDRLHLEAATYVSRIGGYVSPELRGDTTAELDGAPVRVPLSVFVQRDARLRGAEWRLEGVLPAGLVAAVKGDVTRGSYVDGGPLPYMPAARLGGGLRWQDERRALGAEVTHALAQTRVSTNEAPSGAYTLVDLSASYTIDRGGLAHSLTLRVDNLLDREYRESTSRVKAFAPNPGRNLSLVYRLLY
jgi:iron complex outermembrane receptor protein